MFPGSGTAFVVGSVLHKGPGSEFVVVHEIH